MTTTQLWWVLGVLGGVSGACGKPLPDAGFVPASGDIVVSLPAAAVAVEAGALVEVEWDNAGDTDSVVRVFADRDGDPATADDQVAVADAADSPTGTRSSLDWDTTDVAEGTYHVMVQDAFGSVALAPGAVTVLPASAPTVNVAFPPARALTDAARVSVRGTAFDASDIVAIAVAGQPAVTTNGFASWIAADVPLVDGVNVIDIVTEDALGHVTSRAAQLVIVRDPDAGIASTGSGATLSDPDDLVIDPAGDRLLVVDRSRKALIAVDLASGDRSELSRGELGGGARLSAPTALALDGERVLVTDDIENAVVSIDLTTGVRTTLFASTAAGAGLFPSPQGVARIDDRVLICDLDQDAVIALSLTGAAPEVVSSANRGLGQTLDNPHRILIDEDGGRAFVTNRVFDGAILAVDLVSGARSAIANIITGDGVDLRLPSGLTADFEAGVLFTSLDRTADDQLVAVDINTGDRTIVSDPTVGLGPMFQGIESVVYDVERQVLYAADTSLNAIVVIDRPTGDRMFLSK